MNGKITYIYSVNDPHQCSLHAGWVKNNIQNVKKEEFFFWISEISVDINLCTKSDLIANKTKVTKIFPVGTDRCIILCHMN